MRYAFSPVNFDFEGIFVAWSLSLPDQICLTGVVVAGTEKGLGLHKVGFVRLRAIQHFTVECIPGKSVGVFSQFHRTESLSVEKSYFTGEFLSIFPENLCVSIVSNCGEKNATN